MAEDKDDALADVRASIDQLSKGASGDAPQPQDTSETSPPSEDGPEAALDNVAAAPERVRDPATGRFVAADKAPEPKPEPIQATKEAVEAPREPSNAPVGQPPTSWSPEAKAAWQSLPPALQQAVLKREKEMSDGQAQYSDTKRRWQEIDGIIAPRRSYYQRFGFKSDAEAINHLLTLSDSMERDPTGTIGHLARHYNVDIAKLTGGQPAQLPQQQQPQLQQQQPANISQMIREELGMARAAEIVQEFEQSPPEHYQVVKPLMKTLLESGQATDMQDAYDKATWMSPDIRTKMLDAQRAQDEAKRAAAQKQTVEKKTKAANASLSGAPHGTPSARPASRANGAFGEVTDDVRAAISQLSG